MEKVTEKLFISVAEGGGRHATSILSELLKQQVCPRCALRFLGLRSSLYQKHIPLAVSLRSALLEANAKSDIVRDGSDLSGVSEQQKNQDGSSNAETSDSACPVCLGVLQVDNHQSPRPPVDPQLLPSSEAEVQGGTWASLELISAEACASAIEAAGHKCDSFFIEVSLPASTFCRQLAVSYFLEDTLGQDVWNAERRRTQIVDLKEAVRLTLFDPVARSVRKKLDPQADVRVKIVFPHPETANESNFLNKNQKQKNGKRHWGGQEAQTVVAPMYTEGIVSAAQGVTKQHFLQHMKWPLRPLKQSCQAAIRVWRNPIHVGGYYLKLSRNISQSPWMIGTQRKGDSSVQEEIAKFVLPLFGTKNYKFMSAGREDIDVRMMGTGRPFVVELLDAKNPVPPLEDLMAVERKMEEAKGKVTVRKLSFIDKHALCKLKEGEEEKDKTYSALCCIARPIQQQELDEKVNGMKDMTIVQRTPIRVLHRRALMNRDKRVYHMKATQRADNEQLFDIELKTSAGLYVKEFVNGDFGRTEPNLSHLLASECDILTLDVINVHLEFI